MPSVSSSARSAPKKINAALGPRRPAVVLPFSLEDIEREMAYRTLHDFVRRLWPSVESSPFTDGWHIGCICEHLEAISRREIQRLIITVPPRSMKSLLASVFWPAWWWLHNPGEQWLYSSYAHSLSMRDALRCRRLMSSFEYQSMCNMYQPGLRFADDQNTKTRYDNNKGGYRLATSVGGANTGEGAGIIGVDDPHNVTEAESDTIRASTLMWWWEAMSTRLNNAKLGCYVVIGQRTHEADLIGDILERESERWTHLNLPMREEGTDSAAPFYSISRKKGSGDLLWSERFGEKEVANLERSLGEYAAAAQLQQRPSPRGGGRFKVENFKLVKTSPSHDQIVYSVRYWDKAGSEDTGCFTAGVLMHKLANGRFCIADVVRFRKEAIARETRIKQTAILDGPDTRVWVEQEPGSGGKESAQSTVRGLAGFFVQAEPVTGDKVTRADPYSIQVNAGNVDVVEAEWTREFIHEHEFFPKGRNKDQVDAAGGAFNKIAAADLGVLASPAWFPVIESAGTALIAQCRAWTIPFDTGGAMRYFGVHVGRLASGDFVIADVYRGTGGDLVGSAILCSQKDDRETEVAILERGRQIGDAVSERDGRLNVSSCPRPSDDAALVTPFFSEARMGRVKCMRGAWNKTFAEEIRSYPNGAMGDLVAAAAMAVERVRSSGNAGAW